MEEIIRLIMGLFLIIIGILGSLGIIRFAPGYTKVAGVPVGIIFMVWGAKFAGWI